MTKKLVKNILVYTAFSIYVLLMLWLMFGQRLFHALTSPHSGWLDNYWHNFAEKLNIVPFHTIVEFIASLNKGWDTHAFINLAGNVVMFIPLGFLLPCITIHARSFRQCMLVSLFLILFAEIIQLFTLLGSFDIDDLILNIIGVSVGFSFQVLLNKLMHN